MPQLVPFYYLNQVSFLYMFLIIFTYVLYEYILPNYLLAELARLRLT